MKLHTKILVLLFCFLIGLASVQLAMRGLTPIICLSSFEGDTYYANVRFTEVSQMEYDSYYDEQARTYSQEQSYWKGRGEEAKTFNFRELCRKDGIPTVYERYTPNFPRRGGKVSFNYDSCGFDKNLHWYYVGISRVVTQIGGVWSASLTLEERQTLAHETIENYQKHGYRVEQVGVNPDITFIIGMPPLFYEASEADKQKYRDFLAGWCRRVDIENAENQMILDWGAQYKGHPDIMRAVRLCRLEK